MKNFIPHQITLDEAIELTTRFRANPGQDMPLSETFEKDSVMALLKQTDCNGLRIYLGRKADNSIHSVLVAADADGNDILPQDNGTANAQTQGDEDEGILLENALHCPPVCPPPSPLNS